MSRITILTGCLLALLFACQRNTEQVEAEDSYGYTEKYERKKSDFARHGRYEKFNADGVKVEEAHYSNDTLDGLRVLYYDNGDTQVVETHRMGIFEGPYRAYYEQGQLEQEGQYEANVMYGEWKRYYPDGQLMEVVTFADNTENGPFVEYYKNGNKRAEGTYRNGEEQGLLKKFSLAGEHIRSMNCEDGVCRTIWKVDNADELEAEAERENGNE
ncbi:MAG: toxin-antitoxin system YwqK family antitoxin [Phaeodactylibacter sp.]|nr:toxin-antitoxin system YwqK family antitoxin [Phaeodactylibacter sp.]MCB9053025.1 toxin-antitoxin system YwqK family antitoxin [Lewinellaceae bacterium]